MRSAPEGTRPCPAPSHRAPPPVPEHSETLRWPCPSLRPGGLSAFSGKGERPDLGPYGLQDKEAWRG